MKKIVALALTLCLALGLAACGSSGEQLQIGIPADATNGARALLLLQDLGIITLNDGVGLAATERDVKDNPYNVKIVAMEAARCMGATNWQIITRVLLWKACPACCGAFPSPSSPSSATPPSPARWARAALATSPSASATSGIRPT